MSNPVMNTIESKSRSYTPAGYPTMPGYRPGENLGSQPAAAPSYRQDFAQGHAETGLAGAQVSTGNTTAEAVTLDDVILRTINVFVFLLGGAVCSWYAVSFNPGLFTAIIIPAGLLGLVLGIVNIVKKRPVPALILAYGTAEGATLGALTAFVDQMFPGIGTEALIATLTVFVVALGLYKFKIVKVTARFSRFLLIAMVSLLLFRLFMAVARLFGVLSAPAAVEGFFGIPLGILVGVVAVVLATMSLISDFDIACRCVAAKMPKEVAWSCAFGLTVTLVWLYVEILRLLQYVRLASD